MQFYRQYLINIMIKRNAIIMAAGISSRFIPLSFERPKGLLEVRKEILVERQICQLKEAGIHDITLVVGYKAEMFAYLKEKYGISIVINEDYARYNNVSSVIRVIDKFDNTFLCSSDNYFPYNVFVKETADSYYSALYAAGDTEEYCLTTNYEDQITKVVVGGHDSWYMVGHVYFNYEFSEAFRKIIIEEYNNDETKHGYWEDVYIRYIDQLPKIKINRYQKGEILEFDSLDELRLFDNSYKYDTRSSVVKKICRQLEIKEVDIYGFKNIKYSGNYMHFSFMVGETAYEYNSENGIEIKKI